MADGAVNHAAVVAPLVCWSRPRKTRTSHRCRPRPTICPVFLAKHAPFPKNLAHHWHTGARNDCFNSRTWGKGGVRGNQSALHQRQDNNDDHLPEKARVRGGLITGTLDRPIPVKPQFSTDS
jgi:hypothetical protein